MLGAAPNARYDLERRPRLHCGQSLLYNDSGRSICKELQLSACKRRRDALRHVAENARSASHATQHPCWVECADRDWRGSRESCADVFAIGDRTFYLVHEDNLLASMDEATYQQLTPKP